MCHPVSVCCVSYMPSSVCFLYVMCHPVSMHLKYFMCQSLYVALFLCVTLCLCVSCYFNVPPFFCVLRVCYAPISVCCTVFMRHPVSVCCKVDCASSLVCGTRVSWLTAHTVSRSTTEQSLTSTWTTSMHCAVSSSASHLLASHTHTCPFPINTPLYLWLRLTWSHTTGPNPGFCRLRKVPTKRICFAAS